MDSVDRSLQNRVVESSTCRSPKNPAIAQPPYSARNIETSLWSPKNIFCNISFFNKHYIYIKHYIYKYLCNMIII